VRRPSPQPVTLPARSLRTLVRSRMTAASPALLGLAEADGAVRCVACAHRCLVRPRPSRDLPRSGENRDGRLVTTSSGRPWPPTPTRSRRSRSSTCTRAASPSRSPRRGCNFHCLHCQNWTISQPSEMAGTSARSTCPPDAVVGAALAADSRSVAYTYTEPTVFIEYVVETARLAWRHGLVNVLVTNGYQTPEPWTCLRRWSRRQRHLKSFGRSLLSAHRGRAPGSRPGHTRRLRRRGIWVEVRPF